MEKLMLSTPDIRMGDTVITHGMRVLIDCPARKYVSQGREVYAWVGLVTNPDEAVAKYGISRSFLCSPVWTEDRGWIDEQDNRWNVQGNALARWWVERP